MCCDGALTYVHTPNIHKWTYTESKSFKICMFNDRILSYNLRISQISVDEFRIIVNVQSTCFALGLVAKKWK